MLCSDSFILIDNLYKAAVAHKQFCVSPDCTTSLMQLRRAAEELFRRNQRKLINNEYNEISLMIRSWPK